MTIHHDKHHQAYVDKANAALEGTEWADKPIEEVVANLSSYPTTSAGRCATTAAATSTTRLFWESLSPDGGGEPDGDLADGDQLGVRLVLRLPGQDQGDRHRPVRLRLGVAGPRRQRPRRRRHAEPGQPDHRRQDAAARNRRLGARLLPEVPEQAPRLHRRDLERRELGQGRRAVLRGGLGPAAKHAMFPRGGHCAAPHTSGSGGRVTVGRGISHY